MDIYIVFVTAYVNYSLEGYKVDATRYLLKTTINFDESIYECMDTILHKMNYIVLKKYFKFNECEKNVQVDHEVDIFTVGKDREMDLYLAKYDVLGSMAHITMLESIGLLTKEELNVLLAELRNIYAVADRGEFIIEEGIEDVHSQVELMLTRRLGDMGKKIHSGRSRNDQVLLDLKLFTRSQIQELVELVSGLFDVLISQSNRYKDVLLPGYTHLQVAMPLSLIHI